MFVTLASALASVKGCGYVITGIRESNDFPDCRTETLHSLNSTINRGIGEIRLVHPIFNMTREETFMYIRNSNYPEFESYTVSCYNGKSCGYCKPCVDRQAALINLEKVK